MDIFDFQSYKAYMRFRVQQMPKKGRGEYLKLARLLDVHSTMISHVFKGDAHISLEQGLRIAQHYCLNAGETDYFVTLILYERAGSEETRKYFKHKLFVIKSRQLDLSERIDAKPSLSQADQALFYSQWHYLAVHILTSIPGFQNPQAIADRLRLPSERVVEALDFLVKTGLCVRSGKDYRVGITRTYVKRDSPLVGRHHANWRTRVMHQYADIRDEELVYTCPTSISQSDFLRIREKIARFIEDFNSVIAPSKDEEFACLNLDWVKIRA